MADELTQGERIVRIETLVEGLDKKFDHFLELHSDHENRIRSLERAKWLFAGIAAAIGVFGREILGVLGGVSG